MIDPVFVGLVAAAFVFLYGELMRMVRFRIERVNNPSVIVAAWRLVEEEYMDYEEFAGDFLWEIKGLYVPLFVSLLPYVMGVVLLFGGYGVGVAGLVDMGLVLLGFSFVLVGYFCLRMLGDHISGREEMIEFVVGKIRRYAKDEEEGEVGGFFAG